MIKRLHPTHPINVPKGPKITMIIRTEAEEKGVQLKKAEKFLVRAYQIYK